MQLAVIIEPDKEGGTINKVNWTQIDSRISARPILSTSGLYMLSVPAMFPFTEILDKLSLIRFVRIIRISSHSEVQVRISVESPDLVEKIKLIKCISVKFEVSLNPTVKWIYSLIQ